MQQTSAEPKQAYLIIQSGSRWTDVLRLQPGSPVVVGRSSESQVVVQEDRVSRQHAKISFGPRGWMVEDLGSRNGTEVDGQLLDQPRLLTGGEVITVGGCRMTFTDQLTSAFPAISREVSDASLQQTVVRSADIVNRLSNSQWSAELNPEQIPGTAAGVRSTGDSRWNFFYKLIFDLIQSNSEEQAAGIALDRLMGELQIAAGGVLSLESNQQSAANAGKKSASAHDYQLAVLSARQNRGGAYHRVSDFLVRTVVDERQAVLARNVSYDQDLSVARLSGQAEISTTLVAPLRLAAQAKGQVIGLIHLYTQSDQRPLTAKDLDLVVGIADNLALALGRLRENRKLNVDLDASRRKADLLEQQLQQCSELIGSSSAMQKVKLAIQRVAPSQATALVRGESGVGKELVARAIHQASERRLGPMVCLNCAALAPTLLESELFGHEKGAFTGATDRKIGKFEAANRGTLFLDEVGEMPVELQAKFLRVLEGHPFERLGGNTAIHTDVRVIAATNRDLEQAVRDKQFRSDLYFRLRVVEIFVPALREHPDDIPELVEHFLQMFRPHGRRRIVGVSPAALELLSRHHWPGNVRELRNIMERAVVLGNEATIGPEDLGLAQSSELAESSDGMPRIPFRPDTLEQVEQSHILAMLEYAQGNKSKAAQMLGIERSTLDRKLKRFS